MNAEKGTIMRVIPVLLAGALLMAMAAKPVEGDPVDPALDLALSEIQETSGTVGFSIGVVRGGRLIHLKGYGETALETGDPLTADHMLHWASVAKPFVAIRVMQLVEEGRLALDDKLVDRLPDYEVTDPRQREITIAELLLHTSGLPDVEDYEWDRPREDDAALHRWATRESPRELPFDPGTERAYSNVGFEVLGAVIEEVNGKPFDADMKTHVLRPAGMKEATFSYPEVPRHRRVKGHKGEKDAKVLTPYYPWNRRHGPSSTLNASVRDMSAFVSALYQGRLMKDGTRMAMWQGRWPIGDDGTKQATLGWVREEWMGDLMVRHFGWDDGFRSALILVPEKDVAVFFVTNDENAPIGDIARAALGAALTPLSQDVKETRAP